MYYKANCSLRVTVILWSPIKRTLNGLEFFWHCAWIIKTKCPGIIFHINSSEWWLTQEKCCVGCLAIKAAFGHGPSTRLTIAVESSLHQLPSDSGLSGAKLFQRDFTLLFIYLFIYLSALCNPVTMCTLIVPKRTICSVSSWGNTCM